MTATRHADAKGNYEQYLLSLKAYFLLHSALKSHQIQYFTMHMKFNAFICDNSSHSCYQAAQAKDASTEWTSIVFPWYNCVRPFAGYSDRSCISNSPVDLKLKQKY